MSPHDYRQRFDINEDGNLTPEELRHAEHIMEVELREEKSRAQKRMAWTAIVSMIVFTGLLFSEVVKVERVQALADLIGLFYIAQAGVVGAYMGVSAWMSKR